MTGDSQIVSFAYLKRETILLQSVNIYNYLKEHYKMLTFTDAVNMQLRIAKSEFVYDFEDEIQIKSDYFLKKYKKIEELYFSL